MTTLKVPDMHCEKCVARITKALTEAELKFEVSLAEKTVKVEGGPAEAEKAAPSSTTSASPRSKKEKSAQHSLRALFIVRLRGGFFRRGAASGPKGARGSRARRGRAHIFRRRSPRAPAWAHTGGAGPHGPCGICQTGILPGGDGGGHGRAQRAGAPRRLRPPQAGPWRPRTSATRPDCAPRRQ